MFDGIDSIGTRYLCLLVEDTGADLRYVCTPISDRRLYEVSAGRVDLRDVFETPEIPYFYEMRTNTVENDGLLESAALPATAIPALDPSFLPDRGLYLTPADKDGMWNAISDLSQIAIQAAKLINALPEAGQRSAFAAVQGIERIYVENAVNA